MREKAAVLSVVALVGCGGGDLGGGNFDPEDPRLETALLEVVPPSTFNLGYEEEADLEVFYHFDDGEPISGAPIEFQIEGPAADATLAGRVVDTGTDGHATMRLRAGLEDARFTVTATPPVGSPVMFLVAINDDNAGSIVVEMSYAGDQTFDEFTPYLFRGGDCASLDPEMLPMAERIGAPVGRLVDRPGFAGVEVGTDWVVAVVASIAGDVAGFGCTVGVEVRRGEETPVPVTIIDVEQSLRFEGVYDLRNTFDFGAGLPESVDTALNILDELTDDQNIDGDATTMDWGQDPGAFVTDFIMRQTCHWECMAGENYDSCSEINHRLGDLRLLYTEDFTSWSGAQSRFFGGCGGWEVAALATQNFVNDQIGTYVPEIVLRFIDSAGDLARAVTMSQIQSVLTLEPEADSMIPMTHELVTMEVVLRDLGGSSHTVVVNLADAGVMSRTATSAAMSSGGSVSSSSMVKTAPPSARFAALSLPLKSRTIL